MDVAQTRLSELAGWLGASSARGATPLGGPLSVGPWAVLVPSDFDAAPMQGFDPEAFPIYVPEAQAEPLALPAIITAAPDSQGHFLDRLGSLLWRIEEGTLPRCAVVGLDDPLEPISAAVGRAGAGGVDLATFPLLALRLWTLAPFDRLTIAPRVPILP